MPSTPAVSAAGPTLSFRNIQEFVAKQTELLTLERTEEEALFRSLHTSVPQHELQSAGLCISPLYVQSTRSGLYGRCLVELSMTSSAKSNVKLLPTTTFSVRDPVELHVSTTASTSTSSSNSQNVIRAVIYSITDQIITVSLEEAPEDEMMLNKIALLPASNDVTYQRYNHALQTLLKLESQLAISPPGRVLDVLYCEAPPRRYEKKDGPEAPDNHLSFTSTPSPRDSHLNEGQRTAIQSALASLDVFMLLGPPGTGKTTTIVELMRQLVEQGNRILACAPSNMAVDNLLEKLDSVPSSSGRAHQNFIRPCRLGHPGRITPSTISLSLDALVSKGDQAGLCRDIRDEMNKWMGKLRRTRVRSERTSIRSELKSLHKELNTRERRAVKELLQSCNVHVATLTGCGSSTLQDQDYDCIIIDEAAQALEIACLIPILKGKRLFLAGDHCQLGPVVQSVVATNKGFSTSLFDRLMSMDKMKCCTAMLTEQYRMNTTIMEWSSNAMYEGKLHGAPSVLHRLLTDLESVQVSEDTKIAFVFIDTAGCDMPEEEKDTEPSIVNTGTRAYVSRNDSKSNRHEVILVQDHVRNLIQTGVLPKDIAVLAPYAAQVSLLRDTLLTEFPGIEICTVDGVQGREKEAIIISLTRSNAARTVGFLADRRRLNVAITRAKRHVCLIGDSETISSDPFLAALCDYCMNRPDVDYRTAAMTSIEDHVSTNRAELTAFTSDAIVVRPVKNTDVSFKKKTERATTTLDNADGVSQPVGDIHLATENNTTSNPSLQPERKSASEPVTYTDEMIVKILTELLENQKVRSTFTFPDTLTATDRRRVHELSEKFGNEIEHYSQNKKGRRRLVLSVCSKASGDSKDVSSRKQDAALQMKESKPVSHVPIRTPIMDQKSARERAIDAMEKRASAKLPPREPINFNSLKEASTSDSESDNELPTEPMRPPTEVSRREEKETRPILMNKKPKKQNKSKVDDSVDAKDEEDLDDLLAEFSVGVSKCPAPNCGVSVRSMGFDCKYCHLRYCAKHLSPVLHGCAGSAKVDARARMQQNFQAAQRNHSSKPLTSVQRDLLSQKVKQKAETARKSGEKESKKKPK